MADDNFDGICFQLPDEVLDQTSENRILIMFADAGQITLTPREISPLKNPDQVIQLFGLN
jgi:hypothetical protein